MFYCIPWPLNLALLVAPYTILRTVGYRHWKRSGADPGVPRHIWAYRSLKPKEYWVPSVGLWSIQLAWAIVVLLPVQYLVR